MYFNYTPINNVASYGTEQGDTVVEFASNGVSSSYFDMKGGDDNYFISHSGSGISFVRGIGGGAGFDVVHVNKAYTPSNTWTNFDAGQNGIKVGNGWYSTYECERISFDDGTFLATGAWGSESNVSGLYRIAQAALDSKNPSNSVLKSFIKIDGELSIQSAVHEVFSNGVISGAYGDVNSASNADYLTSLYATMLNRLPDEGGFSWWIDTMNHGATKEQVFIGFAQSTEYAQIVGGDVHGVYIYQ